VTTLLLDNSAWVRLGDPALSNERTAELADALEAGQIGTCLPFLLEAGCSARSARDHDQLLAEPGSLPHFRLDEDVEQRSLHRDYDVLAEKTDLSFGSEWLASPGTLQVD
jgi:hypothetical protein